MNRRLPPPTEEPFVMDLPETLDSLWAEAERRGRVTVDNWGTDYDVRIYFETTGGSLITAVGKSDQLGIESLKEALKRAILEADRIINR